MHNFRTKKCILQFGHKQQHWIHRQSQKPDTFLNATKSNRKIGRQLKYTLNWKHLIDSSTTKTLRSWKQNDDILKEQPITRGQTSSKIFLALQNLSQSRPTQKRHNEKGHQKVTRTATLKPIKQDQLHVTCSIRHNILGTPPDACFRPRRDFPPPPPVLIAGVARRALQLRYRN